MLDQIDSPGDTLNTAAIIKKTHELPVIMKQHDKFGTHKRNISGLSSFDNVKADRYSSTDHHKTCRNNATTAFSSTRNMLANHSGVSFDLSKERRRGGASSQQNMFRRQDRLKEIEETDILSKMTGVPSYRKASNLLLKKLVE